MKYKAICICFTHHIKQAWNSLVLRTSKKQYNGIKPTKCYRQWVPNIFLESPTILRWLSPSIHKEEIIRTWEHENLMYRIWSIELQYVLAFRQENGKWLHIKYISMEQSRNVFMCANNYEKRANNVYKPQTTSICRYGPAMRYMSKFISIVPQSTYDKRTKA